MAFYHFPCRHGKFKSAVGSKILITHEVSPESRNRVKMKIREREGRRMTYERSATDRLEFMKDKQIFL